MQDSKLDLMSVFRFEKLFKVFIAIYLSIFLLIIVGVLVKIDMASELQQALIIVLGLIALATIDAFRKALDNTSFSLGSKFNQIIVQEDGIYVGGDYEYRVSGDINNQGVEKRQSLAEAAAEIQQLLMQLERSNPTATDAEKVAYVNDETPPALKSRMTNAVKAGSKAVVETMLDNSVYGNVIRTVVQGWVSSEGSSNENVVGNIHPPVQQIESISGEDAEATGVAE